MEKISLILITLILILSCSKKKEECKEEKYVSKEIKMRFDIIEGFEKGKPTGTSNYLDAISFFMMFSGHETQMKIDGAIGYGMDTIKYKEDLSKWKSWYLKNKCNLTKKDVDSVIALIKE